MQTRRLFLGQALVGGLGFGVLGAQTGGPVPLRGVAELDPRAQREAWCAWLQRVGAPVLEALARRELKAAMPVEGDGARAACTHLEAFGRLLAGLAPWLELGADDTPEGRDRGRWAERAREGLRAATDPRSPDRMNFSEGRQPLVDAAFLAQACLRAPRELWEKLEPAVRENLLDCLAASRVITPGQNNWLLFASMVEAALHRFGRPRDERRMMAGLEKFRTWYAGDGWYGDGSEFHADYYNSFVIHPMLVEVLDVVGGETAALEEWRNTERARFARFAAVQERMIAPDGSFPVLGRSIAYRGAAFSALALAALRRELPAANLRPGQVRGALGAVIERSLGAPGTFDDQGWLRIGLCGHQPGLGENYISTGSLYLCAAAFVPLGLPAADPFWRDPAEPSTWQKAWSGVDLPADHALKPGH